MFICEDCGTIMQCLCGAECNPCDEGVSPAHCVVCVSFNVRIATDNELDDDTCSLTI